MSENFTVTVNDASVTLYPEGRPEEVAALLTTTIENEGGSADAPVNP